MMTLCRAPFSRTAQSAPAVQAASMERQRVEKLAEAVFHDQRLQFEHTVADFEVEANTLRNLEIQRETLLADAQQNNKVLWCKNNHFVDFVDAM